mmetsp:Transcript_13185/g.56153  ORF Transcript_13185/g.56153 Transcript_13185/m.56153 type:complete len:342 (+) Transcript_13185:147-1172(+)
MNPNDAIIARRQCWISMVFRTARSSSDTFAPMPSGSNNFPPGYMRSRCANRSSVYVPVLSDSAITNRGKCRIGSHTISLGIVSPRYVSEGQIPFAPSNTSDVFHQCCPGVPNRDSFAVHSGVSTPTAASIAQRPWMSSRSRSFMMSLCAPICRGSQPASPGISPVKYAGTAFGPAKFNSAFGMNLRRDSPYRLELVRPVRRTAEVTTSAAEPSDQYAMEVSGSRVTETEPEPSEGPPIAAAGVADPPPPPPASSSSSRAFPELGSSSPAAALPFPPESMDPTAHQSLPWNPGIMPCFSAAPRSLANEEKLGSCGGALRASASAGTRDASLRFAASIARSAG